MKFIILSFLFINLIFLNLSFSVVQKNDFHKKALEVILQKTNTEKNELNKNMQHLLTTEIKKQLKKNNNNVNQKWFKKRYALGLLPLSLFAFNKELLKALVGYSEKHEEHYKHSAKVEDDIKNIFDKYSLSGEDLEENIKIFEVNKENEQRLIEINRKLSQKNSTHCFSKQKRKSKSSAKEDLLYFHEEKKNGLIVAGTIALSVLGGIFFIKKK